MTDLHASRSRRALRVTLYLLAALALPWAVDAVRALATDAPVVRHRVIVLGFDGADPARIRGLLDAGKLPNLAKLRAMGMFSDLQTTNPAESPVAWASFATGSNPGKTNIFDFLKIRETVERNTEKRRSYVPEPAMARREWIAFASTGDRVQLIFLSMLLTGGLAGGIVALFARTTVRATVVSAVIALIALGATLKSLAVPWWGTMLISLGLVAASRFAVHPLMTRFENRRVLIAPLLPALTSAMIVGYGLLGLVPSEFPQPASNRRGTAFWEAAANVGKKTVLINVPVTFPAPPPAVLPGGRLLSGLGTPDIAGTNGLYTLITDAIVTQSSTEFGGNLVQIERDEPASDGFFHCELPGPWDVFAARDSDQAVAAVQQELARARRTEGPDSAVVKSLTQKIADLRAASTRRLTRTLFGQQRTDGSVRLWLGEGDEVLLAPGGWSDLVPVSFEVNPLVKLHGLGRFHLIESTPNLKIYLSPLGFDPRQMPPTFSISTPPPYAAQLFQDVGPYKTLGWATETMAYKEKVLDEQAYLDDMVYTMDGRWRLMQAELQRADFDLMVGVFEQPDRLQHCFFHLIDPQHPIHDAAVAAKFGAAIDECYEKIDGIVGEVMEKHLDANTSLFVVSDHGFSSWRYQVNLNTWLASEGFMNWSGDPEKQDLASVGRSDAYFGNVDWSRTKAFSMGLGGIYINYAMREPNGAVTGPDAYEAVCDQIIDKLKALRDPARGNRLIVRNVWRARELYNGPWSMPMSAGPPMLAPEVGSGWANVPDLIVGFEADYRVSWQTCLGGGGPEVIEENLERWSGDHCSVDPELVPGALFASRTDVSPAARIWDLAPTICELLGVPIPEDWDGRSLVAPK
jgi:predicted AlkP superfamily phosphohydrolase/phosphomutase